MTTNKYSPVGNGPQKSMWTVHHGSGGRGDIWRGSGRFSGSLAWHKTHWFIISFTSWSIFGNHIFSRNNFLVFTRPWWPSWAMDMALWRSEFGITMRLPRRMTSASWLTVNLSLILPNNCNSVRSTPSGVWSAFVSHWSSVWDVVMFCHLWCITEKSYPWSRRFHRSIHAGGFDFR